MSDATLDRLITGYMATNQQVYSFAWQGGEPTLMGVDFFRRAVQLQTGRAKPGTQIANGLQTNGTLLNDEFAELLAEYKFLVGVSLDGPAKIHDAERYTIDGRGSHRKVMAGIECMRRHEVQFNILTLVNRANVSKPEEIYDYLVDHGFLFHQYVECVEFEQDGTLKPFAITGEAWGTFLCRIFDRWIRKDTRRVSVRLFDTILAKLVDNVCVTCTISENCCQYFVVEHNGDVYPCDFHVRPEWKLGNVMMDDWEKLQQLPLYAEFGKRKTAWNSACSKCEFLSLCNGDCPKNRGAPDILDSTRLSNLCAGLHVEPYTGDAYRVKGSS
jgi:uncharacterized protein